MLKKWSLILSLAMAALLLFGAVASAFVDLPEGADRDKIRSLQERGIVDGYGNSFMGNKKLSNAEGVHLIVKGMDLSLAAFLFIKEPLASDSFDKVPNDAWYSNSFVIASVNGLELPRSIDPTAEMTREAFAHHLLTALLLKGDYAFTKMYYPIEDDADVNPDYRHSLQLLLNAKIVELDRDRKFNPKKAITRREAAVMLYNTLEFVKAHQPPPVQDPHAQDPVSLSVAKVNDDVNKVTLTWGEKPNSGYALSITGITFGTDGTAQIHYKRQVPEHGKMYAQVITTPKAETFLSTAYKPVLVEEN